MNASIFAAVGVRASCGAVALALLVWASNAAPAGQAAPANKPQQQSSAQQQPQPTAAEKVGLSFVNWGFENASPLQWDVDAEGVLNIRLLYDYERNSPNRAAGHWHFQLQGRPGAELTLMFHNFENIYNRRPGVPVSKNSICFLSEDGRRWRAVPMEFLEGNRLRLRVKLESGTLYLARLEPYRISDLEKLLEEIRGHKLVEIADIGRTVEGRPLEMIRVGNPEAAFGVLLRARSHSWEPGGNWVVQGLIRALLEDDEVSRRCLKRYCLYVMPMANKDGVARGLTRFNMQGRDLNRNWDQPADPQLAPENHALETWLKRMIAAGKQPQLAIDLHNDESGGLHLARPPVEHLQRYLDRMKLFEELLRKHTWFTEGSSGPGFRNPGTLGEGLLERFGIDACIMELNCNWIAGLKQYPSGAAWEQFGRGLREVFFEYFGHLGAEAENKQP